VRNAFRGRHTTCHVRVHPFLNMFVLRSGRMTLAGTHGVDTCGIQEPQRVSEVAVPI